LTLHTINNKVSNDLKLLTFNIEKDFIMDSYRDELTNLLEQGAINEKNIDAAVEVANIVPSQKAWLIFLDKLCLWLSLISMGFSLIYFIAHNWSEIGKLAKFALIETALIVSILTYLKTPVSSVLSNASLILSTLLLGALMALFGQTYQTGVDPWQLFFNWALLMTPWALIAKFSSIWLIWLALLNLSVALYSYANVNPLSLLFEREINISWSLFILDSVSLLIWYKLSQSRSWLQKPWAMRVIAISVGLLITTLTLKAIFDENIDQSLALPVWLLFIFSFYWAFRKLRIDLFMLAGASLSAIVVIVTLFAHQVLQEINAAALLLLAILVISLGVGAALWLKKIQQEAQ
jgi:uncharacterized membrane protein